MKIFSLTFQKNIYICSVQVIHRAVNPSVLRCNPGIFYARKRQPIWRCANPVTRLQWPVSPVVGLEQREVVRRFFRATVQKYHIMQNAKKTAGETATKTLVIIRDCHAKNNLVVTAKTESEEKTYRRMATRHGYLVAVRKPKQPTCDNCANMTVRTIHGSAQRHCDLMGLYIPEWEQHPTCNFHQAVSKFETLMAAQARKGGAR